MEINTKYVVITPVRNEEKFIEKTITSMINQNVLPEQWIIVDDNSTDKTFQIISDYERKYDFITAIRKTDDCWDNVYNRIPQSLRCKDRMAEGAVPRAFNYGLGFLEKVDYDFIVKLDGDISFDNDYFEKIFHRFFENPRLGIAGGHCYQLINGKLKMEKVPDSHVRGATKIYRRECFCEIGKIKEVLGWDAIDEMKAQIFGWKTKSFADCKVTHWRLTGSASGIIKGKVRHGITAYRLGYHPLFMMARIVYRLFDQPVIIGSLLMLYGFAKGYVCREVRVVDFELMKFIRKEQAKRIFSPLVKKILEV